MDGKGVGDGEFFEGFGEDFFSFLISQDGMGLVVKLGDIAALVVVPHEALEGDDGAAGGVSEICAESSKVESGGLN